MGVRQSEVKDGSRVLAVDNHTWALPSTELPEDTGLRRDGESGLGCASWGLRQSQREESGAGETGLGWRDTRAHRGCRDGMRSAR